MKAPKRKPRQPKMMQTKKMPDFFSSNPDSMASFDNTLDKQILQFMWDFGNDKLIGRPLVHLLIPMCQLVPMELVRLMQKHGKGVKKLEESFLYEGYARMTGAKFYAQLTDWEGQLLNIREDKKKDWDELWREQDRNFMEECEKDQAFK
jgi:hypothetical protein